MTEKNSSDSDNLFSIRPYARLLTMLGEQLIKNERIALSEIVKNSYDADASWVSIRFTGFGEDFEILPWSKIIIEDDGFGMSDDTIKKHWLNPATPGKKLIKGINDRTPKGRILQGEKGIGRFAVLKLGRKVEIITRPINSESEWEIDFDFSKYDDDFLKENGEDKELFLSDLSVKVIEHKPTNIVSSKLDFQSEERAPHGTRITISALKGAWNAKKIEDVFKDLSRLQSSFHDRLLIDESNASDNKSSQNDFRFYIFKDSIEQNFRDKYTDNLENLLRNLSVFKIENGHFNAEDFSFRFQLNNIDKIVSLNDPELRGTTLFKRYFGKKGESLNKNGIKSGNFEYGFYIFDFDAKNDSAFHLTDEDKKAIKSHRIYLYRDNIRVYPYGDEDDDWLRIDALRGTISAGQFLSNDQVVGFIKISQKENPELKDKTNREGLIDTGQPYDDFMILIQIFLAYLRAGPYAQYLETKKAKNTVAIYKEEKVKNDLVAAKMAVKDNREATLLIETAEKNYLAERSYLVQRAETTEDLAGVGLSVETASHDIQSIMGKAMALLDSTIKKVSLSKFDVSQLFGDLTSLRGMLSFIESQLKDIQLLFKSSKQRRRDIRVIDIVEKVNRIYQSLLQEENVHLEITASGSPLVAKTTDAVLLQVLLNLFDNAIYWLETVDVKNKKIEIRLDGNTNTLYFSDNGPGIRDDDKSFIFEPFYSGKGDAGRGLGLYIARQLLERHEYSIDIADLKSNQYLPGANFVISFAKE